MKNYYLFIIFLFSFCFNQTDINTPWGNCLLINNGLSFDNEKMETIILKKINNMHQKFGEIPFKNNFTIIIDNGGYQTKNVHWKWSLGITFKYPEKIIIKDPSFSHTTQKRFETVLEHELNHLLVNRIDVDHTIPRWFKEGFAMFHSNEISLNHKLEIARNLHNQNMFNLDAVKTFRGFSKKRFDLAYAQSAIYVLLFNDIYGEKALDNILFEIKNGLGFEDAFYASTSQSINEFEELLYPILKQKYWWFNLISLPNQLFAFFPLLLIIAFIIRSNNNNKIEKKWELEEELENLEEEIND